MQLPDTLDNVFTSATARLHGLTKDDLRTLVRRGQISRLARQLYARDPAQLDLCARANAFGMLIAPHHVICDRTAAWVHGVDIYSYPGEGDMLRIEVCARRDHTPTRRPEVAGCVRDLTEEDIVYVDGVAVTSPARTALDLACKLRPMSALACIEAFLRKGLVTIAELVALLPRYRGRRGIRLAREVLTIADARVESEGESFTRMAIHQAGLPLPSTQVWVYRDDAADIRLDTAYEGLKIAIEYDGVQFHGPDHRAHDDERRGWLRDHGWYVIVVRKADLSGAAADAWLADLRRELRERTLAAEHYSRFARV